jgi:hypothetical protein
MATSLMTRPSSLVAVSDEYAAFCLDEAVWEFGALIEQQLDDVKVGKNAKPEATQMAKQRLLEKILTGKSKFREPTATK